MSNPETKEAKCPNPECRNGKVWTNVKGHGLSPSYCLTCHGSGHAPASSAVGIYSCNLCGWPHPVGTACHLLSKEPQIPVA